MKKKSAFVVVCLLSPLLSGGAHCGMTNYAGPIIDQAPINPHRSYGEKYFVSLVRFRREALDYKSAEITIETTTNAAVRACEPPLPDGPVTVFATVRGKARVPVHGTCFEVAFDEPSPNPTLKLETNIDRQFVLQRNCSPHGPPCLGPESHPPGTTIGEGKEGWTLWAIELTEAK